MHQQLSSFCYIRAASKMLFLQNDLISARWLHTYFRLLYDVSMRVFWSLKDDSEQSSWLGSATFILDHIILLLSLLKWSLIARTFHQPIVAPNLRSRDSRVVWLSCGPVDKRYWAEKIMGLLSMAMVGCGSGCGGFQGKAEGLLCWHPQQETDELGG